MARAAISRLWGPRVGCVSDTSWRTPSQEFAAVNIWSDLSEVSFSRCGPSRCEWGSSVRLAQGTMVLPASHRIDGAGRPNDSTRALGVPSDPRLPSMSRVPALSVTDQRIGARLGEYSGWIRYPALRV